MERGLKQVLPGLRKTVVGKLAFGEGAMIEGQTPNTVHFGDRKVTHIVR